MVKKKFGYKKYLKQKEKKDMSTLKVFLCSFVLMLVVFTVLINYFAPEVDVSIGNAAESPIDDEQDNIYLKKFVDDRLLTIQQEDMAQNSSSVVSQKAADVIDSKKENSVKQEELKPVELITTVPELKIPMVQMPSPVVPSAVAPVPSNITVGLPSPSPAGNVAAPKLQETKVLDATYRVYIGHYHTYDQVKIAKEIVSETDAEINPVIKELNGGYTLQAGVFKSKDAASVLTNNLLKQHLPARMVIE